MENTLIYQETTETIRQMPQNYLIAHKHHTLNHWICDPDLAADSELCIRTFKALKEHSNKYGTGLNLLAAITPNEEFKSKRILYHGSNTDFNMFDPSKIKYVGCNGDGFYFTNCKKYAETYGKIVKAWEVEIKNPLTPETKVMNFADYKNIVFYIWHNTEYKEDLKNYGYFEDRDHETILMKIAKYLNSKDTDYSSLFDLTHAVTGSIKELLKIVDKVTNFSFDAIISKQMQEYVVFNPEQIKLIRE